MIAPPLALVSSRCEGVACLQVSCARCAPRPPDTFPCASNYNCKTWAAFVAALVFGDCGGAGGCAGHGVFLGGCAVAALVAVITVVVVAVTFAAVVVAGVMWGVVVVAIVV